MSGIKSMEHGALGEARAKAFLLERFWVLERSVDVQGADYLIQRRLTDQNFMDRSPPKLGVVQVKYAQDGDTWLSVPKDYVCDVDGHYYNEFFLLLFTGHESGLRSFILSAADLKKESKEVEKKGKIRLKCKAAQILGSSNYEIRDYTTALDRIDHALRNADFLANRRFLSSSNYVKISQDHIDHDLLLPLDNHYADIGKAFYDEKQKLQRIMFEVDDVVSAMKNMLMATDPEYAFQIYEEVISDHIGAGHGIVFSADFFSNEDFLSAVTNHKQRLSALRELGVEGAYFALLRKLETEVPAKAAKLNLKQDEKVRISLVYHPTTLDGASLSVERVKEEDKSPHLVLSKKGQHIITFLPFQWLPYEIRAGKQDYPNNSTSLENAYRESSWQFRRPIQSEIEKHLIGEELALWYDWRHAL